jgi:hypothetical protein
VRKTTGLYVFLVAAFGALASAQTTDLPSVNVLADTVREDGGVVQMNGNVRIAACGIVTADSATWRGTDIDLGGSARLQLTNGVDRLSPRKF